MAATRETLAVGIEVVGWDYRAQCGRCGAASHVSTLRYAEGWTLAHKCADKAI